MSRHRCCQVHLIPVRRRKGAQPAGGRRRENENDDREEEEENGYEWTQYPDHEYAYWIDFEQGIFELQSASHEERWTFAQLRKETGFWMALVRSQILSEKTLEE
ncbi:hypothetical protein I317_06807 [Kwoniella heveanensis CBS 569]|nr:hypothetical protein I317_06807 [Kwoniella heveanensis CBS 569]